MQIVRDDSDALVLQTSSDAARKWSQLAGLAACGLVAAGSIWLATTATWWQGVDTSAGISIVIALLIGPLSLGYALCLAIPYGRCIAFDRNSRQILIVCNTLFRATQREVIDFDDVQRVLSEVSTGKYGHRTAVYLLLANGRKIFVAGQAVGGLSPDQLRDLYCAMNSTLELGEPDAYAQQPKKNLTGRPAWAIHIAISIVGIVLCSVLGQHAIELWQAPHWPQTEAVIDSIQLGKKQTTGKHPVMKDAIEIDYHFAIDGVVYHGSAFNTHKNWLAPDDVPFIKEHYVTGGTCRVSYNPSHPDRSYLHVDAQPTQVVVLAVISTLIGLAGLGGIAYNAWKMMRSIAAPPQHSSDTSSPPQLCDVSK
ncbi:MAG TPA: DUF3592 domain-containing protein [Nitrolancea sp.]|nr:DUF3592 domain-containing protein [Nitrolancea sp.]